MKNDCGPDPTCGNFKDKQNVRLRKKIQQIVNKFDPPTKKTRKKDMPTGNPHDNPRFMNQGKKNANGR